MERRAAKKPLPVPKEEGSLRHRLEEALSEDELGRVLTSALLVLDAGGRKRLLARLGPETAAALAPVLAPPPRSARGTKPAAAVAGKGKLQQEWDRSWQQWAAVVEETGDEEGKYVQQEAHWESPYVDTEAISADLDASAARMRPLIPRVIAEQIAPAFSFVEAIDELDDDLGEGLPDWLDLAGGDGCYLGPEATSCLLEWEWIGARRDGRDAPAFLDAIRDLEGRLENVTLDQATIKKFVLGLSSDDLRAILDSMIGQRSSERWADAFTRAYGCWSEIQRDLSQRWNPALFAETSRAGISQDWTLALPLVKGAIKRKAFTEAAAIIDEAVRALLRLGENDRWDPRTRLLMHAGLRYYGDGEEKELTTLLELWQKTAEAEGHADLVAALALQRTALRQASSGEIMLEAFRAVPPEHRKVHDALFADWRALIVERTLETRGAAQQVPCGGWVSALVDAAKAGPDGAPAFHAAVRSALKEASAEPKGASGPADRYRWATPGRRVPAVALAVLTRDLDATAPVMKRSTPTLFKLLSASSGEPDSLAATRRIWCARLGGPSLLPEVLAFWRNNAARFVPDPGAFSGEYAQSADWLAAVREINPTAAGELLARWIEPHQLKRNLWRDLAQRGFAPPAGVRRAAKPSR
jgi:hypothetical protein